jgi:uncharacterized protein
MKCPVCNDTQLVMAERQGIEIDYCPQCRGVWLDRGELDKLIERSTVVPESRGRDPHDYRDEPRARDYRYDEDYHHPKKRHRGFLGELFDFDLEAVEVRRSRNSFRWFAVHSVLGCALLRRLPAEHAQHHEEAYDIGECDAPRTCSNVGDNIAIGSLSMLRCGWPASRRPRARQTSGRDRRAGCTLKAPHGARPSGHRPWHPPASRGRHPRHCRR